MPQFIEAAHELFFLGDGQQGWVIHLAAYFDLEGTPHPDYERVTVAGTRRLLRELQSFEVHQFVFASSMLVHAPGRPGEPINEDRPLDPKLPYRESKIKTEKLIREERGRIPAVFVRPAGVYDDRGHAVFLAHQIARIYQRKLNSRVYPGNVDTGQPFLHLNDLTDAFKRIVDHRRDLPPELPLLLAEPKTPTFAALQHAIGCLVHGQEWETREIPEGLARAGAMLEDQVLDEDPFTRPWMIDISSDHYEVDISRAKALLGWRPRHTVMATLPKIIEALKADPPAWYRDNKLDAAVVADRAAEVLEPEMSSDHPESHAESGMQEHRKQMRGMHFDMLWVHYLNILLGAWLVSSAFAFGAFDAQSFGETVRQVTAERGLAEPAQRMAWLGWSDVASGTLIMLFGALSLSPRFSWAQWGNAAVGFWLLFAPLVFWAPSAAVYNNDTLVGALVIAFAVLVPMMPGMSMESMMDESNVPVGWTYSPSTYLQRLPIVALAFIGFVIARQLAAYQLGHVSGVWEPFFAGEGGRNGTETIITSSVSKAWPIADGGLGAVSYMLEVLMGLMGGRQRWRTMPWMVAAFGVVVVPLGVVSIYFIIIQPIVIGTWCSLCLLAALAMIVMIPYTLDELVAMSQFLVQGHRRGEPFWRTFFMGGASPGSGRDEHPDFDAPPGKAISSALRGVQIPWTLAACTLLGAALMFTRLAFGTEPPMADSDHLVGALIVTVAISAMAEVGRLLRFINVVLGLWLIASPWILSGASMAASAAGIVVGIAVVGLSLPRGRRSTEHYGSWDRLVL
ncbi:MAG: vitamin K epoxide reductase family protein [Stagnimonas sp.]|nr:vitamin K epoxide reductase family protein [Stagnimonas sp.]